ncbi:lysophospholipid acyltransferase family protein [Spirosoma utsteinense]|uniref:1-acyl-sn-glycerol-3-phosphate acyltransferase n=1 Tax=Spirosoma utsteinense TaxID=2585773 RepID=A0ABR6W3M5_9BACT|nr:lysophospholipid acyltransferase family protein [Spirosoma utsteinense]MBC3784766.1 1-acyl-sn-glycerol-3-phosphate acyltransferase [Spirosoma utsteinense]MBC3791197.1 1-acyl-sn-glycerol-3-phosphate acyltransferase [Spirosoma utsteinense]
MRLLYTIWCAICLVGLYLILFPIQFVFLQRDAWKPMAHRVNAIWGHVFFALVGIPVRVTYRYRPDPKQVYVFCANHFSYIDIAVMGVVIKNDYAFVGKSDVKTIPLLGYMFAKLHVQVDRNVANSRAYSLAKSIRTLQAGRSIMIFPEGGIVANPIPRMAPFKDGAFTMAIQQQVPIVPITLLTNYRILPDDGRFRMQWYPMQAVVHPPVDTAGMTQHDVEQLKQETYRIIDTELKSHKKVVA